VFVHSHHSHRVVAKRRGVFKSPAEVRETFAVTDSWKPAASPSTSELLGAMLARSHAFRCVRLCGHYRPRDRFALNERGVDPQDAARTLNVDYVVSGSIRRREKRVTVEYDPTKTRSAPIVWTNEFERAHDPFLVPGDIGDKIVASIASEIEANELNRAILRPPASLDAWEAPSWLVAHVPFQPRRQRSRAAGSSRWR
jgi:TolB-like protein